MASARVILRLQRVLLSSSTNGLASLRIRKRIIGGICTAYDTIGRRYSAVRQADPRIAARIRAALGDARTLLNVGAGTGSYEPRDLAVTAVEPSAVMRAQRPPHAAAAIDARAEELPFPDRTFDASMAILSDHHWSDHARGLAELRRVSRDRVVLFTWDPDTAADSWLVRDYIPGFIRLCPPNQDVAGRLERLGGGRIEPVPIPYDCRDGFLHAYWRRPEAYLDERMRSGISVFSQLEPDEVRDSVDRLRADLESGEWRRRNGALLELGELDLGYRLLVAEYGR